MKMPAHLYHSNKFYFVKLSLDGHLVFVNDYFARRFSFIAKRFVGLHGSVTVHPRDYDTFNSAFKACLQNEDGKSGTILRMMKPGNGCFLTDWEFSASHDEKGVPDGVCCTGVETTDTSMGNLRVEMKLQLLKQISDSSSDSILLLDTNYKILAYNKPAEYLSLDLHQKKYIAGDDFRKYVRPEAQHLFYRQYNSALQGITTEQVFEMTSKNGGNIFLKVEMSPAYEDDDETVCGAVIVTKDITLMQDLNNRLNEVTSIQSHQVRRPVANMISLVNLLDGCDLGEREKEYLQLLKISIEQMEEEIRQIVKTARKI